MYFLFIRQNINLEKESVFEILLVGVVVVAVAYVLFLFYFLDYYLIKLEFPPIKTSLGKIHKST